MTRQSFKGIVVSQKTLKTVKVRTQRLITHPKVLKQITRHRDFMAHDESAQVRVGDSVRIEGCRPMSATKRFAVAEILARSKYPPPPTTSSSPTFSATSSSGETKIGETSKAIDAARK